MAFALHEEIKGFFMPETTTVWASSRSFTHVFLFLCCPALRSLATLNSFVVSRDEINNVPKRQDFRHCEDDVCYANVQETSIQTDFEPFSVWWPPNVPLCWDTTAIKLMQMFVGPPPLKWISTPFLHNAINPVHLNKNASSACVLF